MGKYRDIREYMRNQRCERAAAKLWAQKKEDAERDRIQRALERVKKEATERRTRPSCSKRSSVSTTTIVWANNEARHEREKKTLQERRVENDYSRSTQTNGSERLILRTPIPQSPVSDPSETMSDSTQSDKNKNLGADTQKSAKNENLSLEPYLYELESREFHTKQNQNDIFRIRKWELEPLKTALDLFIQSNATIQQLATPFKSSVSVGHLFCEENVAEGHSVAEHDHSIPIQQTQSIFSLLCSKMKDQDDHGKPKDEPINIMHINTPQRACHLFLPLNDVNSTQLSTAPQNYSKKWKLFNEVCFEDSETRGVFSKDQGDGHTCQENEKSCDEVVTLSLTALELDSNSISQALARENEREESKYSSENRSAMHSASCIENCSEKEETCYQCSEDTECSHHSYIGAPTKGTQNNRPSDEVTEDEDDEYQSSFLSED